MIPIERLGDALRDAGSKSSANGGLWACPVAGHGQGRGDRSPSLQVFEDAEGHAGVKCHGGCTTDDVLQALGISPGDLRARRGGEGVSYPPRTRATVQPRPPFTVAEYAAAKHIDEGELNSWGVTDAPWYQGGAAVCISYMDAGGTEIARRFRQRLSKAPGGDDRFRWKAGTKVQPYGLWRLPSARKAGRVVVVEGESDAHTLWHHDIPALGIPGASNWKPAYAEHLKDIDKVFIIEEPDEAGAKFIETVGASLGERLFVVRLPDAKDPSLLHMRDQGAFVAAFESALDSAIAFTDLQARARAEERSDAWEQCQDLAQQSNILDLFVDDLRDLGVAGEERNAKLTYLAVTSRVLDRIVSIVAKGPSSAGKSHVTEKTLEFFPESAYYARTAMSERSLIYSTEPLRHRMLVIFEAAGIQGDFFTYTIRSLLSEGRLEYEVVEKGNDGEHKTRVISREGPTGIIITTTEVVVHAENETRLLSLQANDTADQTHAVLAAIANGPRTLNFDAWHALQEWIGAGDYDVVIPYAGTLAELIPPVAVRLRRDFSTILALIKTHAILHQATREMAEGRIVASIEDYDVVRGLTLDLISEGVQAGVLDAVRETVDAVRRLAVPDAVVTAAMVSRALGIDKSSGSRRVRSALQAGYLRNEALPRSPMKLAIGEPLPEEVELLPKAEVLAERSGCTVAVVPEGIEPPPSPATKSCKGEGVPPSVIPGQPRNPQRR